MALGIRVVFDGCQFRNHVLATMWTKLSCLKVYRPVETVERPLVCVKLIKGDGHAMPSPRECNHRGDLALILAILCVLNQCLAYVRIIDGGGFGVHGANGLRRTTLDLERLVTRPASPIPYEPTQLV